MSPHKLITTDHEHWKCVQCAVLWKVLTERDRAYLSSEGTCHGEDSRWYRCKYSVVHCLGKTGHEECVPLLETLNWTSEELSEYMREPDDT